MADCVCGVEPSSRDFGIQVQGVYDGTLIWSCWKCGRDRPRFDEGRLHRVALEFIDRWRRLEP